MAAAWVEVLVGTVRGGVRAIHLKGSAVKPWDSPIDYVPGLSDVDIHVTLTDDTAEAALDDLEIALRVNRAVLEAYRRRVPDALHVPRPQLVLADRLTRDPNVLPSPAGTVETLWGETYPAYHLTAEEQAVQRSRDRDELTRPDHLAFVDALPLRAIDRLGDRLVPLLGELNWRVSPVAPRVLEVLGAPYAEAWGMNRTSLVAELRARSVGPLAAAYESYYLAGWRLFLEGPESVAADAVLSSGVEVVRLGARFASSQP